MYIRDLYTGAGQGEQSKVMSGKKGKETRWKRPPKKGKDRKVRERREVGRKNERVCGRIRGEVGTRFPKKLRKKHGILLKKLGV